MSSPPAREPAGVSSFRAWRQFGGEVAGLIGALVALVVVFGLLSGHFWSQRTLVAVANQIPDLTLIAVGMTLVVMSGGIDLSVGSAMALGAAVLGLLLIDLKCPLPVALLACVAAAALCGLLNGLLTAYGGLPSFIVTLGTLEGARGVAYLLTQSQTKYLGRALDVWSRPAAGVAVSPAFLVALAAVLAAQVILARSAFGRYLIAVGANETALRLAGVDPRPVRLAAFVVSGALAGAAGIFQASRLSTADPNAGVGIELSAIAAVVIGGTSLSGGRGSAVLSFLGVIVMAVLQTGLTQVGASDPVKRVMTGLVIVVAVLADAWRRRWTGAAAH